MTITSRAFVEGGRIPVEYTCNGEGINPPLQIEGIPDGAKSLVLIMEDLDSIAGTWDHWVKFNMRIESDSYYIEEGVEPEAFSGRGTSGSLVYMGPCPQEGEHRYVFKAFAIDKALNVDEGATKEIVLRDMEGSIVDEASLMAVYSQPK